MVFLRGLPSALDVPAEAAEVREVHEPLVGGRVAQARIAKGEGVVPVEVHPRRSSVRQGHGPHPRAGPDLAGDVGVAADDEVGAPLGLELPVGGIEQPRVAPRRTLLRRGDPLAERLLDEGLEVVRARRLAPDHPVADRGVAPRRGAGEVGEVAWAVRRVLMRPAAVGPGRRVDEHDQDLHAMPPGLADRVVDLRRPPVGGVARVAAVLGGRGGRVGPRDRRLKDRHAEILVDRKLGHAVDPDRTPEPLLQRRGAGGSGSGRDERQHEQHDAEDPGTPAPMRPALCGPRAARTCASSP